MWELPEEMCHPRLGFNGMVMTLQLQLTFLLTFFFFSDLLGKKLIFEVGGKSRREEFFARPWIHVFPVTNMARPFFQRTVPSGA